MKLTVRQLRQLIREQLDTASDERRFRGARTPCANQLLKRFKNPEEVKALLNNIEGIYGLRHSHDHSMIWAHFLDKDAEPEVSRHSRDRGSYYDPVSWDKVFAYDVPDVNGYPASLDKPGVRPFTKLEVRQKIKNALGCDPASIGDSHSHAERNIRGGDLILPYLEWKFDYSSMEEDRDW